LGESGLSVGDGKISQMTDDQQQSARASATANVTPLRKPVKCPNCAHKSSRDAYPFCSKRCQDVDLNRWFSEVYSIPIVENDYGMSED